MDFQDLLCIVRINSKAVGYLFRTEHLVNCQSGAVCFIVEGILQENGAFSQCGNCFGRHIPYGFIQQGVALGLFGEKIAFLVLGFDEHQ